MNLFRAATPGRAFAAGRSAASRTLRFVALCVAAALFATAGSTGAPPASRTSGAPFEVDIIGDSLSTGLATPGEPWTRDAQALLDRLGQRIRLVDVAENGAGYVTPGVDGDRFADQVARAVSPQAAAVVLFGSDNDLSRPGLATAVRETLDDVRSAAPQAAMLVVGPPAPPAQQPRQVAPIRDVLQTVAAELGVEFVDPLALGWFRGPWSAQVSGDREHPNSDGERFLAFAMTALLVSSLARAGHA